jgi:carbon-monoxide dehydrogenase large subunit|tara:strand:- start:3954 stop:6368 length:2415 start_codon:yes stop_codon:yes gene_type:complete
MSSQAILSDQDLLKNREIGKSVNSKLGKKLVTGQGQFIDDLHLPGMLYARFVRSPHAHARIISIDTSDAKAYPGVELVWTAEDIDPYVKPFGHPSLTRADEEALASDKVRYVGDEVAIVLAKTKNIAIEAADLVRVEYEKLPAVVGIEDALAEGAPVVHPTLSDDPNCEVKGNLLNTCHVHVGNYEDPLSDADIIVEGSFKTHKTNPSPLEPHGCVAHYDRAAPKLTLWSSNQVPHLLRKYVADTILNLEVEQVVCKMPDIGGGFGVKLELFSHEICASVLAMVTGKPVNMVLDRIEELKAGRGRHPETFTAKLGLKNDGTIVGMDIDMFQNTGAYGSFGKTIAFSAMATCSGPYPIPNQRITGSVVYTNVMPGSAVRGYGDPQFTYVREQLVDMAAEELGMDPIDLRLKNVPRIEDMPLRTPSGLKWVNSDMPECLHIVRDRLNWDKERSSPKTNDGKLRGIGMATIMKRAGNKSAKGADYSSAIVQMNHYGQVTVFSGICSIGQGTETALCQIVADVLGISTDDVTPVIGDSDITPDDMGVWADRGTIMGGTSAAMAAENLKQTIVSLSAWLLKINEDDVEIENGLIHEKGNSDNGITMKELAHKATFGDPEDRPEIFRKGVSLVGAAKFETLEAEFLDPETGTGNISHGYTFGAFGVIVEIDPGTGVVQVVDAAICEDVGKLINPKLLEGQTQGGIIHGLGEILLEEMVYDSNGNLENGSLVDYHLPTAADVPMITKIDELENPDPSTSHGQKGAGECSTVPVPAAVANAVYDATGIRFFEGPLTPRHVLPRLVEAGLTEL